MINIRIAWFGEGTKKTQKAEYSVNDLLVWTPKFYL